MLEEFELWDIVGTTVTVPDAIADPAGHSAYVKKNIKAKRIILDVIKDHIIPRVSGKKNAYKAWESLCKLYQSSNQNRKMMLREKLRNSKMHKIDIVTSYLTKVSQV